LKGIWVFQASFDRSYPAGLAGSAQPRPPGFRSLLSRNFDGFRIGELPGTFVPNPDYFCNPRAMSSVAWSKQKEDRVMLGWVVTFLIVALIAGILGFGGVAGASIEIAKIIFFIAVVLFLISAVVGLARGRTQV
jgi:uncharacterized membrane protein YtjA (UPF0391 family)